MLLNGIFTLVDYLVSIYLVWCSYFCLDIIFFLDDDLHQVDISPLQFLTFSSVFQFPPKIFTGSMEYFLFIFLETLVHSSFNLVWPSLHHFYPVAWSFFLHLSIDLHYCSLWVQSASPLPNPMPGAVCFWLPSTPSNTLKLLVCLWP